MAIAVVPSITSNRTIKQWAGKDPQGAHMGHALQHVGTVNVPVRTNSSVPLGGFFDCWYCPQDHTLLIDITSTQVGGPV